MKTVSLKTKMQKSKKDKRIIDCWIARLLYKCLNLNLDLNGLLVTRQVDNT